MEETKQKELAAFGAWLYANEKAEATVKKYLWAVGEFLDALGTEEATRERLIAWREHLSGTRRAQTVNGALSAVNAWLLWKGRPEVRVKYLKVQRTPFLDGSRRMGREEYGRLLCAAKKTGQERLYMIMLTLGGTGIRVSELRCITVEAAREGGASIRLKGKTRRILLGEELRRRLLEYAAKQKTESGMIFRTRGGKPLDRSNLCHEMKRLCRAAGVSESRVFPHSFRHLFARVFYAVQKNLANLADVLGHSSIETTRIYVADSAETYRDVLKRMDLIPKETDRCGGKEKKQAAPALTCCGRHKKIPQNPSSVVKKHTNPNGMSQLPLV